MMSFVRHFFQNQGILTAIHHLTTIKDQENKGTVKISMYQKIFTRMSLNIQLSLSALFKLFYLNISSQASRYTKLPLPKKKPRSTISNINLVFSYINS